MKRTCFFLIIASCFAACNNSESGTSNEDTKSSDAKVAGASDETNDEKKMDYAYTIEKPDQWERGSRENTKMVLASLKGFEKGDMDAAVKDFADTVELRFDAWEAKIPRDSVKKVFAKSWSEMKNMSIIMDDFESVISKDKKNEYVSLWYKQKWQDAKGAWDSLSVMDDLKIKDGKIASIDEKIRHYPKKKM
jgi:hypothetical protein